MKLFFLFVLTILPFIANCTSIQTVYMQDGKEVYVAKCKNGMEKCMNAAHDICSGEYIVYNSSSQQDLDPNYGSGFRCMGQASGCDSSIQYIRVEKSELWFTCKNIDLKPKKECGLLDLNCREINGCGKFNFNTCYDEKN